MATGRCGHRYCRTPVTVPLGDPIGISTAFAIHEQVHHEPAGWLIGSAGGATTNVCNPCGGQNDDRTPRAGGPDHTACRAGMRGRGGDCECRHRGTDAA